jgi:hypothetical protein
LSAKADILTSPDSSPYKSNLLCFSAMVMWSFAFPIAEVMLVSWGTVALVLVRQLIGVMLTQSGSRQQEQA